MRVPITLTLPRIGAELRVLPAAIWQTLLRKRYRVARPQGCASDAAFLFYGRLPLIPRSPLPAAPLRPRLRMT